MIELKRLRLINWHNFENVTFDCARLTYMIGVNAVGKTTILDAIRYCLTASRSFNALGNKKSGRTLQGSVHAKQRGEDAYRRPGRTVAYIGAEFWDGTARAPFVIAARVESESPHQELRPGDQTWYVSDRGCTLEQLPFLDKATGAPTAREDFHPAEGRLSYTRSPGEARDRICRALGIGRASSPLGKKFGEVFQMGTSMDEIPNFREFLYQYVLPQPQLDLEALQGDRLELENLHGVLAEAQARADALEQIVQAGAEAEAKQREIQINRGAALTGRAAADAQAGAAAAAQRTRAEARLAQAQAAHAAARDAETQARRAYLAAHSRAGDDTAQALDALAEAMARKKTALDQAARTAEALETAARRVENLAASLRRSGAAPDTLPAALEPEQLDALRTGLEQAEKPLEQQYFAARQKAADLTAQQQLLREELAAVSGGKWVYPHEDAATKVRDAVNAELTSRGMQPDAKIFCELLTVEDESWQDCVEACLGDRRFDILVPPAHYAAAKSAFVALGSRVGPISLLDSPGIRSAARKADAPPPDSLAAQVSSQNPLAAQYADALLRRIRCCDSPDTLEHSPDSATRDLLRHHPFRLERLRRPQRYIGLTARRARAEALTAQLTDCAAALTQAQEVRTAAKAGYDQYQKVMRSGTLDKLSGLPAARTALEQAQAAYDAARTAYDEAREDPMVQQLYQEAAAQEAAWETARTALEQAGGDVRVAQSQLDAARRSAEQCALQADESARKAAEFFAAQPLLEAPSRQRLTALGGEQNPAKAAAQAEKAQPRLEQELAQELAARLEPAQQQYNQRYACSFALGLDALAQYRTQYDSLVRIDLERYAARLEQAQRDCRDRFRKDILFRMKDDISSARRQFRELNRVMEQLCYGEEVYRFELGPSRDPQLAAFYQVIVDKGNRQMTPEDSLDNLAATADPLYERQVDALMEKIMTDVDENARARRAGRRSEAASLSDYVDYRTYLDYDIQVTNRVSGQKALLSRVSRDSSGGENQAPFYVAICASLLQIYLKSENSIRLVLLDEAFSKMTSDRIRPMMELFRRMQLQVLLISTVEKSTAIQPYCDVTYSIVRHGDANAIAPFYRLDRPAEPENKEDLDHE